METGIVDFSVEN